MPDSRTQHEHGLALENATRREQGLPEITLEQFIEAGYRYQDTPRATATERASAGPALDVGAIYRKLNTPAPAPQRPETREHADRSSGLPRIDAHADGEAFAASIYARANARHGAAPRTEETAR